MHHRVVPAVLRTPQSSISRLSTPLSMCERNWLNAGLLVLLPLFNHDPQGVLPPFMKSLY